MINFLIGFIAGAVIMTIIGLVITSPKQEKSVKSIDNSSIYPNLHHTLRIWYDSKGKKHEKSFNDNSGAGSYQL